jgi:carboxylesterase type B
VWLYEFAFPPIDADLDLVLLGACCNNDPPTPGVFHGTEQPFVFGGASALGDLSTLAARALSRQLQAYWDAFASAGEPVVADQPVWQRYDAASRPYLVLADPIAAAFNFRVGRCELLVPAP